MVDEQSKILNSEIVQPEQQSEDNATLDEAVALIKEAPNSQESLRVAKAMHGKVSFVNYVKLLRVVAGIKAEEAQAKFDEELKFISTIRTIQHDLNLSGSMSVKDYRAKVNLYVPETSTIRNAAKYTNRLVRNLPQLPETVDPKAVMHEIDSRNLAKHGNIDELVEFLFMKADGYTGHNTSESYEVDEAIKLHMLQWVNSEVHDEVLDDLPEAEGTRLSLLEMINRINVIKEEIAGKYAIPIIENYKGGQGDRTAEEQELMKVRKPLEEELRVLEPRLKAELKKLYEISYKSKGLLGNTTDLYVEIDVDHEVAGIKQMMESDIFTAEDLAKIVVAKTSYYPINIRIEHRRKLAEAIGEIGDSVLRKDLSDTFSDAYAPTSAYVTLWAKGRLIDERLDGLFDIADRRIQILDLDEQLSAISRAIAAAQIKGKDSAAEMKNRQEYDSLLKEFKLIQDQMLATTTSLYKAAYEHTA